MCEFNWQILIPMNKKEILEYLDNEKNKEVKNLISEYLYYNYGI